MKKEVKTLDQIPIGEEAFIKKIHVEGSIRRRLLDIGMIEGTKVECLLKSPTGNPIAYFIRGAVIAIRNEDSKLIEVEG